LILKKNLTVRKIPRFQGLSTSIGRFLESIVGMTPTDMVEKYRQHRKRSVEAVAAKAFRRSSASIRRSAVAGKMLSIGSTNYEHKVPFG
jgi:hypothetical protein